MSDRDIEREFLENYKYAHDYFTPFNQDAKVYTLAQSGYTWADSERKKLSAEGREALEFNIMRRPLQFYSGYLRDNLKSVVISPFEGSDRKTADQLSEISSYVWDKSDGYPIFINSAVESFKSGLNLCGIRMDYSKDFVNGDIALYSRTYNSFFLDPTFERIDLKDCGFGIMRDLVNKSEAKMLLPFVDPNFIDDLQSSPWDDKFMSYHPNFTNLSKNRNLVAYDQYYRRTSRTRKMLIDLRSGFFRDITDIDKDELKQLQRGIARLNSLFRDSEDFDIDRRDIPRVEIRDVERPYIELCVLLNGKKVYSGDDKTGIVEDFPFAPHICYFEPSIWMSNQRFMGISGTQWSMQRQFNKRHMKIIDMMDSTISTGFKYLLGTVPDPQEMQQTGQNKLIGVDPEDNPAGLDAVQELNGGNASPALIEYQKVLDDLSLTLANITESLLGIDEGGNTQVSGRLAEVRVGQGLRSSRGVFDNVEETQRVIGSRILTAIQKNYPPGKVKRILNEEPTEQFYESQFEQYDAILKEGVRSKSQKDAYYYELVNLKRDQIVDVPESEIVRALQMTGMSDLEKAIEERERLKAEQEQKINEQELMLLKLQASQAEANTGLAQERRGRVVSDIALASERASEAEENRAQAALKRAQTITEIASLEEDNKLKVLEFVNMLERQEKEDRDRVTAEIQAQADAINSETPGSAENRQAQAQAQANQGG
jgi:hypothetical protein